MELPATRKDWPDLAPEPTLLLLECTQELLFLADRYDRVNDQPAWLRLTLLRIEELFLTLETTMPWEAFAAWARKLTDTMGGPPSLHGRIGR